MAASPDWFDDVTFWTELYPFLFPPERFAAAEEQVENIVRLTGIATGDALDLCCGPGRHSVALAKRGFRTTGVDHTEFLLSRARTYAADSNVSIEFVLEDMRRFSRPEAFDLVISVFTSFGFFDEVSDDLAVLRQIHRNLRPGGTLLMEMASKERLAGSFQPTISTRLPDGALLVQRHQIIDDWTRVKNEWVLVRDGDVRVFEFRLRVYSGQELKTLLSRAGFDEVQLYGHFDGRPYDSEVKRLVAVAKKPAAESA